MMSGFNSEPEQATNLKSRNSTAVATMHKKHKRYSSIDVISKPHPNTIEPTNLKNQQLNTDLTIVSEPGE